MWGGVGCDAKKTIRMHERWALESWPADEWAHAHTRKPATHAVASEKSDRAKACTLYAGDLWHCIVSCQLLDALEPRLFLPGYTDKKSSGAMGFG